MSGGAESPTRGADGPSSASPSGRWLPRLIAAGPIALIALVGWWPSLGLWFPEADTLALVDTARLEGVGGFLELWTSRLLEGTGFPADYYRPVSSLSFALDFSLWGLDPFGYQLTNLLLHTAVALSVGQLVLLVAGGSSDRARAEPGWPAQAAACGAALVLLFHPLAAEVVPSPARRQDLLATLFLVGSLSLAGGLFLGSGEPSKRRLVGGWVCWALALGSKEIAVVGAPVLVLLGWWSHRRGAWGRRPWIHTTAAGGFAAIFLLFLAVRTAVLGGLGGEVGGDPGLVDGFWAATEYVASWIHPSAALIAGLPDHVALPAGLLTTALGVWVWARFARFGKGDRVPGASVYALGLVMTGLVLAAGPMIRASYLGAVHQAGVEGTPASGIRRGSAPASYISLVDWHWGVTTAAMVAVTFLSAGSILCWRRLRIAGPWKGAVILTLLAPVVIYALARNYSVWSGYIALVPIAVLVGCLLLSAGRQWAERADGREAGTEFSRLVHRLSAVGLGALLAITPTLHGLEGWSTASELTRSGLAEVRSFAEAQPPRSGSLTVVGFPTAQSAHFGRPTVSQLTMAPKSYTVRSYLALFSPHLEPVPAVELRELAAVEDPEKVEPSRIRAWSPEEGTVVLCWPGAGRDRPEPYRCPDPPGER